LSNGQSIGESGGDSIGQQLTAARVEAGLSIEAVSEATRIRQTIIRALEEDDFSRSGGDFYARAHIRGVAEAVHTDPAPLLAAFDARQATHSAPTASEVFESETASRAERRGPNWSAAMAAALALIVIYGGVKIFTGDDSGTPRETTVAGTLAPTRQPTSAPKASAPAPKPSTKPQDAIAQAPRDKVSVELSVSDGKSWVSVTNAGGETLYQGLLEEGQEKTWTDRKKIKMTVGNAGAVSLVVNGKKVGAPGGPGEVARVQFGPDDPENG
jgi:cytoskeletal protein RodZ